MIDELIQKQVEEFRKEFRTGIGRKWILTEEESAEVEAHLIDSMKKVGEEIVEKVKSLRKYPNHTDHDDKDEWYACVKCQEDHNLDAIIDSLTYKGE